MRENLSVNRMAWEILEELIENAAFYRIGVEKTSKGTTIVDAGINAEGSFEAGRMITELCMGGLGKVEITSSDYGDVELQSIFVHTDNPVIAILGSQFGGWRIVDDDFVAIGSGPARALAMKPKRVFQEIEYHDESDRAVMVLETEKQPPQKVIDFIARNCRVKPEKTALVIAPTTSLAGGIQVCGRIVETGIHKLTRLGFDPKRILHAWGSAPVSPVHPKFAEAMARTNDAILYGGISWYIVDCDDEEDLKNIVQKAPSSSSKTYGRPFMEILKQANYDLYKIDSNLFAPAIVTVTNAKTGRSFTSGKLNIDMLLDSFEVYRP